MIEIGDVTVSQARKSTLVVAGVMALVSAWQLYRGRSTAAGVLGATVALLLVCGAIPAAAVRFHKYWMVIAGVLGYVNSRIILSALFFLIVTPVGVIVRLAGHDPLERRGETERSYWRPRSRTRQSREGYERAY